MKIVAEKKALVAALVAVSRVVETRNTYPILANCKISADADTLSIVATDLDIEVTEHLAVRVESTGETTLPARALADICKKAPDGAEITIDTAGENTASVRYGRSRFSLATLDADSFPTLTSGELPIRFTIPADDLKRLIAKTSFAISNEETRYYLNGIYLHHHEGSLRAVATDGHRMSIYDVPCPSGAEVVAGIIVPKKTVAEIAKLIDAASAEISVEISDTKIKVTAGETVLLSKIIEGQFPDYQRVTPKANNKVAAVSRDGLLDALDRVGIMASDKGGKAVKLAFNGGTLALSVTAQDHGEASEELETSDIGETEIGFNVRYLAEEIRLVDGDTAHIAIGEASGPAIIRDPNDASGLMVLMPMRC